jgi:hypothetical protein
MSGRKKTVKRQKSGGRQKPSAKKATGRKTTKKSTAVRSPTRLSATEWVKASEEHHERRATEFGRYDTDKPDADLPPMMDQKERSIYIPEYVNQDQNRTWQAKCVYLLFTNAYWTDTNYAFAEAGKQIDVTLFDNGRERGYTFRDRKSGKEISFSEARSSDSIVVFPFNWQEALNDPTDLDYLYKSKYFKYGQFYEVFEYILEYFDAEL